MPIPVPIERKKDYFPLTLTLSPVGGEGIKRNPLYAPFNNSIPCKGLGWEFRGILINQSKGTCR
jgi:hypothetical protein